MTIEPLQETERRVLGVLMEKSIAQPDYYPMTTNAVVAACNQKNNRDPIMELDDSGVDAALDELRKRGLVSVVLPAPGARTTRYRHETAGRFGWERRVSALMTELFLRGPQTPGELRSRASRLAAFENVDAVMTTLEHMQQSDPPLVKALPRQAGQSAVRYMHLLYPPEEMAAVEASAPSSVAGAAHVATRSESASESRSTAGGSLQAQVDELRAQVARLSAELEELRGRFSALEADLR